jgi:hypothetical protein
MTRTPSEPSRPLLLVDIDGVISLFGVHAGPSAPQARPALRAQGGEDAAVEGSMHSIEGIPHFLSSTAAAHLLSLAEHFELVWASGWEERAGEHLPHLLGLPPSLPFLRFSHPSDADPAGASGPGQAPTGPQATLAHWKLESVDAYAGDRPLAWIDDAFNPACEEWAANRRAATLLVATDPVTGLTRREARLLEAWALELAAPAA